MKTEGSSPFTYSKPDESNQHAASYSLKVEFAIILPSTFRSSQLSTYFRLPYEELVCASLPRVLQALVITSFTIRYS
jgi:hypothetical protein